MGTSTEQASSPSPQGPGREPPRPYLIVLSGPQFGELFDLAPGEELLLGRSPDARICLQDEGVSRRHATIVTDPHGARLVDAGSANGTWVNGARVSEITLHDGMRFQLGARTTLKYVRSDDLEAEAQRRLTQGAFHEPLTGLYNRRHFLDRLSAELAASLRHGRPIALLLVDVDHLEQVNEAHGHAAGDEALKMVAHVLRGAVRREDVVARYGGEEFAILARETGLTGARALAERIRRALERSRYAWAGQELAVTVSAGVTAGAGLAQLEPVDLGPHLLEAAGRALQRAKQGGGNSVFAVTA
jgi:diguanylate cyclase (GGDEF)-like protein